MGSYGPFSTLGSLIAKAAKAGREILPSPSSFYLPGTESPYPGFPATPRRSLDLAAHLEAAQQPTDEALRAASRSLTRPPTPGGSALSRAGDILTAPLAPLTNATQSIGTLAEMGIEAVQGKDWGGPESRVRYDPTERTMGEGPTTLDLASEGAVAGIRRAAQIPTRGMVGAMTGAGGEAPEIREPWRAAHPGATMAEQAGEAGAKAAIMLGAAHSGGLASAALTPDLAALGAGHMIARGARVAGAAAPALEGTRASELAKAAARSGTALQGLLGGVEAGFAAHMGPAAYEAGKRYLEAQGAIGEGAEGKGVGERVSAALHPTPETLPAALETIEPAAFLLAMGRGAARGRAPVTKGERLGATERLLRQAGEVPEIGPETPEASRAWRAAQAQPSYREAGKLFEADGKTFRRGDDALEELDPKTGEPVRSLPYTSDEALAVVEAGREARISQNEGAIKEAFPGAEILQDPLEPNLWRVRTKGGEFVVRNEPTGIEIDREAFRAVNGRDPDPDEVAFGSYADGQIRLAQEKATQETLQHERGHLSFERLTDRERKALMDWAGPAAEAESQMRGERVDPEEYIAQTLESWKPEQAREGVIPKILGKMAQPVRRAVRAVRPTAEGVLERMQAGEMLGRPGPGQRAPAYQTGREAPSLMRIPTDRAPEGIRARLEDEAFEAAKRRRPLQLRPEEEPFRAEAEQVRAAAVDAFEAGRVRLERANEAYADRPGLARNGLDRITLVPDEPGQPGYHIDVEMKNGRIGAMHEGIDGETSFITGGEGVGSDVSPAKVYGIARREFRPGSILTMTGEISRRRQERRASMRAAEEVTRGAGAESAGRAEVGRGQRELLGEAAPERVPEEAARPGEPGPRAGAPTGPEWAAEAEARLEGLTRKPPEPTEQQRREQKIRAYEDIPVLRETAHKYQTQREPRIPNPEDRKDVDRLVAQMRRNGYDVDAKLVSSRLREKGWTQIPESYREAWRQIEGRSAAASKAGSARAAARQSFEEATPHVNRYVMNRLRNTSFPESAGYIRPTGALVDFSGGGDRRTRGEDHRIVGGTAGMQELGSQGWIRWMPESNGLDMYKAPTEAQYRQIRSLAERANGEVIIDLQEGLGEWDPRNEWYGEPARKTYLEYPAGTKPAKIVGDIRRFYAGEDLRGARYQIRSLDEEKAKGRIPPGLIATHFISPDSLRKAAKAGGLVAPSFALSRSHAGGNSSIILVGSRRHVDPAEPNVNLWSSDAYTARIPASSWTVAAPVLGKMPERLGLSRDEAYSLRRALWWNQLDDFGAQEPVILSAFLKDAYGIDAPVPTPKDFSEGYWDRLDSLREGANEALSQRFGRKVDIRSDPPTELEFKYRGWLKKLGVREPTAEEMSREFVRTGGMKPMFPKSHYGPIRQLQKLDEARNWDEHLSGIDEGARGKKPPYYEAKVGRSVPFSELAGAAVPEGDSASAELLDRLGVPVVVTYRPGEGGTRAEWAATKAVQEIASEAAARGVEADIGRALEQGARYQTQRRDQEIVDDARKRWGGPGQRRYPIGESNPDSGQPPKPYSEQRYPYEMGLVIETPDGQRWVEGMKGLNRTHALQRAAWNWDGAKIREATPEEVRSGKPAESARYQTRRERDDRWYFSSVRRAVDSPKFPRAINGDSALAMIRKQPGVKDEELAWTGLDEFLKGKGKVTKEEVQQFLDANETTVEETVLGKTSPRAVEVRARLDTLEAERRSFPSRIGERTEEQRRRIEEIDDEAERLGQEIVRIEKQPSEARFGQYVLPGGEKYRELLIRLPSRESTKGITELPPGFKVIPSGRRFGVLDDGGNVFVGLRETEAEARQAALDKLNEKDSANYEGGHYGEYPNVLAHIRFNERTDADGKRVLFVEEIQSDWHQKGREEGYKQQVDAETVAALDARRRDLASQLATTDSRLAQYVEGGSAEWTDLPNRAINLATYAEDVKGSQKADDLRRLALELRDANERRTVALSLKSKAVPDAPFKKTWHELAFRRAVRWAAENGFDRVAWTTGAQQADRYDLSKHISALNVTRRRDEPGWMVDAIGLNNQPVIQGKYVANASEMADLVGKELAEKIENANIPKGNTLPLSGLDLRVGGEGMRGFYDQIIPSYAKKFGKKFGASVGEARIQTSTPREPYVVQENDGWYVEGAGAERPGPFRSSSEAESIAAQARSSFDQTPVHAMDITPEMRRSVMEDKLPLYQTKKLASPKPLEEAIPDGDLKSDEGYVYHATSRGRLAEIAESGRLLTHKPWDFTDQDQWPDGSTEKRAYFSDRAHVVWQFAPESGTPVVIRAKSGGDLRRESTGDTYSTKPIRADRLEVLASDGEWYPIRQWAEMEKAGPRYQTKKEREEAMKQPSLREAPEELGRPMRPEEAPRVETKVAQLRAGEEAAQKPPSKLARDDRQRWVDLDPEIRALVETRTDEQWHKILKQRRLDAPEVQAWEMIVRGKEDAFRTAQTDLMEDKRAYSYANTGKPMDEVTRKRFDKASADVLARLYDWIAARHAEIEDGTGTARALAARARVMKAAKANESFDNQLLRKIFKELPGVSEKDAGTIVNAWRRHPEAIPDLLRAATSSNRTIWKKALELWKAGLLSAPSTDLANITGNMGEHVMRLAESAVAPHVESLLLKMRPGERERFKGEAAAEFSGGFNPATLAQGLRKLFRDYRDIALLKDKPIDLAQKFEFQVGAVGGTLGKAARTSFRKLEAEDAFSKFVGRHAALKKLAFRKASAKGGPADEIRRRAAEIVRDNLDPENPRADQDILQKLSHEELVRTFQEDPGDFVRWLVRKPWLEPFIPFKKTPANILRRTIERSPFGLYSAAKAAAKYRRGEISSGEAADIISRATVGTALFAFFGGLASAGLMTGGGPADFRQRNLQKETGWQPYSFVIPKEWIGAEGDVYIPFSRFEPVGSLLGMAADAWETVTAKDAEGKFERLYGMIVENLTNKSYLKGLSDVAEVYSEPRRYMATWLTSMAGTVVPNVVARGALAIDPVLRDVRPSKAGWAGFPQSLERKVRARIPVASKTLPARQGPTGEPIERPGGRTVAGGLMRFGSPSMVTQERPGKELEKLLVRLEYAPPPPRKELTVQGVKVPLTDADYAILLKANKDAADYIRRRLIGNPKFERLPDTLEEGGAESKKSLVEDVYRRFRTERKRQVYDSLTFRRAAREAMGSARAEARQAAP